MEYAIANPVGLDKAIKGMAVALEALPWLEKSFGRAFVHVERNEKEEAIETPKVYKAKGEYENVFPNDKYRAFSFWTATSPEVFPDDKDRFAAYPNAAVQRDVAVIFWVNLKKIDPTKDYVFTEELKADVKAVLLRSPYVLTINEYQDEDVQKVYEGFDLDKSARYKKAGKESGQWLMYPYAGMRFDLTITYNGSC